MNGPSFPLRTDVWTYVGLLALTLSTVLIGYVDLGWGSMFAGAIVWFLILVSLTMGDYITRGWLPSPGK